MGMARAALLLSLLAPCSALKPLDGKACNGDPGLCELSVDQVTWPGTHNADASGLKIRFANIACLTDNHEHKMVTELEMGLRFFDVDTCYQKNGDLKICHGVALGDMFKDEMQKVKEWMDANTQESIVILFTNAKAEEPGDSGNREMMRAISSSMQEVFGDMLLVPTMRNGVLQTGWPKLGKMVETNKRVVVLWGQKLYYHVYQHGKTAKGFRDQHIWFDKYWAQTYRSSYKSMMPDQLGDWLEQFCDDPDDETRFKRQQPMVLVDGYLTISASRKSLSFCNMDLAGDVNPTLLEYDDLSDNPLLGMQDRCWAKRKQISLVSMDYVEYFPARLDRIGKKLNERNFARYAWIGGQMNVSGAQAAKTDPELQALLAKLGGVASSRISVEKKDSVSVVTGRLLQGSARQLSAAAAVHFSVLAQPRDALGEASNSEVLAKIREGAKSESGVDGVKAVCRDPGFHPTVESRSPQVRGYFLEGEQVTFTCKAGLVAHGTIRRVCGPDGLFTGVQPSCLEAWTAETRLMPLWLKVLLILLLVCCLLGCLGGCVCLCCRRCRRMGYTKVVQEM